MPTYHINATITTEELFRVTADSPRQAVMTLYRSLYEPDKFLADAGSEEVEPIQDEGARVVVTRVYETNFVGYTDAPLVDETAHPAIEVDMSEPAGYERLHGNL